jgi:hypothetical protein
MNKDIILLLSYCFSLQEPGRLNPKYKIDGYYGSRVLCNYHFTKLPIGLKPL